MRKKMFLILMLMLIVFMLSNFSFRGCMAIEEVNTPPAIPSNPTPEDKSSDVSMKPTLLWESSDPDGDALKFDIYFGTESNPPLVESDLSTSVYLPGSLEPNTTYYWKVVAKDGKGGETEGPVWSFTTEKRKNIIVAVGGSEGIFIFDVSELSNPKLIGHFDTDGEAGDVQVSGNYVYVADGWNGLAIVDISDPTKPIQVGRFDTPGYARAVQLSGNYAYVGDSNSLIIVDILNSENPKQIGCLKGVSWTHGIFISGNYTYIADGGHGLIIIDVSNPENPKKVGNLDIDGSANDIYVSGNYAYVADGSNGLVIVDITDPTNPVLVTDMLRLTLYGVSGM